jgi:DNA-binding Xre family transcriptional regulator/molecular chaperone GrpE (heat shock protein)
MKKIRDRKDTLLTTRMQALGFKTYRQLSQQSGLSMKQLRKVRKGQAYELRLDVLIGLAQTLQVGLGDLLDLVNPDQHTAIAGSTSLNTPLIDTSGADQGRVTDCSESIQALRDEYKRLQAESKVLVQQTQIACQAEALQLLEPWLQYWPVAAKAAQENPAFQATKLIPLCKPVEALLNQWQVAAIAAIGSEVPYDPQFHQLIDGSADVGDPVRVRYPGYLHHGNLHFRAKVSPLLT